MTLLYEYYECFSATQDEINEIIGQKDFFDAIKKIEEHSDYKDINNENFKNAFLRGRLKACDYKWNFDQDLLQKLRFDEQIIIISHLQNFVIEGKNQNDNQQNQQQNEFVIKYIEKAKDFANLLNMHFSDEKGKLANDKNIKIQAEIINVNVLTAIFFGNSLGKWLQYIPKKNYDVCNISDDIVVKLVCVASQKCGIHDFCYDLSSLDIDELLDFYVKSEVQNKIEISGKKNESNQEAMKLEIIDLKKSNKLLKTKNSHMKRRMKSLLCDLSREKKSNNLLMPIYICLCAVGVVFAGFMLWLISLISVTWAIVQMSIFIVSILFLLVTSFIDTDKHETFRQRSHKIKID